MSTSALLVMIAIAFVAAWVGVALLRRWILKRNLLDEPNERSSHTVPTPRGGGLVIVGITLIGYTAASLLLGTQVSFGYLAGGLLVAGVSWLDDLYSLPFWSRLIAHIAAATLIVLDLGQLQSLYVPLMSGNTTELGRVVGAVVTIGWLVWLINAYNFMDGIDGIAGVQAIVASGAWLAVGLVLGMDETTVLAGAVMAASAGFLVHNWQPASIFMGDVGSAFLGFTLASLPLLAAGKSPPGQAAMLGVAVVWFFVFDTIVTMFSRAVRGERIWQAHRQHLYQRMVIGGMSHAGVTLLYGAAAAMVSIFGALSVIFSGNYDSFLICSVVLLTAIIVFSALWKKR